MRTKMSRATGGVEGYNPIMIAELQNLMPLWAFFAAFAVAMAAGVVKGAIGFGLPLLIVSGLSLFLDPLIALAGVVLPALLSNVVQTLRFSRAEIIDAGQEFWRYIVIVVVMIFIVTQFVTRVPEQALYMILGVPVVVLSVVQLMGVRLIIPPHRRRAAEWGIGGVAGIVGGFTGSWGPPTVMYLMALDTPKDRTILVQGLVFSLGAVSLLFGHIQSGVFTSVTAVFSALLLVPMYLGQRIGFWWGDRLDADLFRKITLIVLVVAGANLVRRGLLG